MVFIAMNQDDILSRTAQYQIQYVPSSHNRISFDDNISRHSMERDHTPRHIVSIHHRDDGSTHVRRSAIRRPSYSRNDYSDDEDHRTPEMPQEFATNQPDFRITTECTSDEEDYSMPHPLRRAPNRIGSLPFETETSDSEDAPFTDDFTESFHRQIHPPAGSGSSTSHPSHSRNDRLSVSLAEAWDAHASATQEAVRAVGGELLVPHARFFIEKKKSKCTIRFDPPVSGRFILLKMWSSHHDVSSNIDIQSVMARGYAGPRYFPSVELS